MERTPTASGHWSGCMHRKSDMRVSQESVLEP